MLGSAVSVAVMVSSPSARSVAANDPWPLTSTASAGKVAFGSFEVKWMVPAYVVSTWADASSAVTLKGNGVPPQAAVTASTYRGTGIIRPMRLPEYSVNHRASGPGAIDIGSLLAVIPE